MGRRQCIPARTECVERVAPTLEDDVGTVEQRGVGGEIVGGSKVERDAARTNGARPPAEAALTTGLVVEEGRKPAQR